MKNIESVQRKRILEKKKKKNTKRAVRNGLAFLGVFMIVIGVVMFRNSFAFFKKEIVAGNVDIRVDELVYDVTSESLTNNQITVEAGKSITFEVEITSQNPITSKYELYYNVSDGTSLGIGYMENTVDGVSGVIAANGTKTVTLKIVNDGTSNKTITFGVEGGFERNELVLSKGSVISTVYEVELDPYVDEKLNGTDPELGKNMIAVTIAADGTVKRANTSEAWYDYDNQEWANAIIPLDKTKTYNVGDTILDTEIESYFVWIPRYRYKIFNDGDYSEESTSLNTNLNANAPQTIEIEFEDKTKTPSNGSTVGSWLSHPAFQAFDSNGFWVGKFESGYKGATSTEAAEVDSNISSQLVIKPNAYSWRSITVGNAFKASYDYLQADNSHMMKNTEWGAVAYLSHSQYGKQNEDGVNTEVYINNNSTYLTGCGGDSADEEESATCKNAYGSKESNIYNQSTTGNISGVFDMSGGAYEYVMGYNTAVTTGGSSGILDLYSDFLTNNAKWGKYYDKYPSSSYTAYNSRILGDATGEMGPFNGGIGIWDGNFEENYISSWYDDYAHFAYTGLPWFLRGGYYGHTTNAGVFSFNCYIGGVHAYSSFRVDLAP